LNVTLPRRNSARTDAGPRYAANWQLTFEGNLRRRASTRVDTSSGLPLGPGVETQMDETRRKGLGR
jgi:hypothetical protein